MEYYYNKKEKRWTGAGLNMTQQLSPDKIRAIKNARRNKRYLIVEHRDGFTKRKFYPGVQADNIYFDISDVKLFLDGGEKLLLKYKTKSCSSTLILNTEDIKNKEVLKKIQEDLSVVVDFVEDTSYISPPNETLSEAIRNNNYWSLSEEAKLFYQMEGNYNFF